MSEIELGELAKYYQRNFGGKIDDVTVLMADWYNRLRSVSLKDAVAAFTKMIEEDIVPRNASARIAAMCKLAGVVLYRKPGDFEFVKCDICRSTGLATVPHPRDYDQYRNWNGQYDCVVACRCGNGRRYPRFRTLENYEAEFPHWKDEYPIRAIERCAKMNIGWAVNELEALYRAGDRVPARRLDETVSQPRLFDAIGALPSDMMESNEGVGYGEEDGRSHLEEQAGEVEGSEEDRWRISEHDADFSGTASEASASSEGAE